jgi:hypothetical protein
MSNSFRRSAVIAAMVALLTGGMVATATPAYAISSNVSFTATATELTAVDILSFWPLGPIIMFPVSISRVVDGTEQEVASGRGVARYQCNGTAVNTYTAIGQQLTVPCG